VRFVETLYADEVNLHNPMQFLGQSRKERFGIAVFADFMRYDWSRNRYSVSVGWISTDNALSLLIPAGQHFHPSPGSGSRRAIRCGKYIPRIAARTGM